MVRGKPWVYASMPRQMTFGKPIGGWRASPIPISIPATPIAATRFRAVREAYEAMQGQGARGGAGAVQVIFSLVMTAENRSLSVNETLVAVGTSEGEVYLFDHDGKVLKHHADLGRGVDSV